MSVPKGDDKGESAFRSYLDGYKRSLLELISERGISKREKEPPAPWLCYHHPLQFDTKELEAQGVDFLIYAEKDSFFWFTLDGSACMNLFLAHIRGLSLEDRLEYFKRFDLGPRWVDRKAWFDLVFDEDGIGAAEYERAHAEILESPGR